MSDTLTSSERRHGAATIQAALAANPEGAKVTLTIPRGHAVRLANTLRGHDTLDLGDKVFAAFDSDLGDELTGVVADVLRRMDADEYAEVIGRLRESLAKGTDEPPRQFLAERSGPGFDVRKVQSVPGADPGDETLPQRNVFVDDGNGFRPATAAERQFVSELTGIRL